MMKIPLALAGVLLVASVGCESAQVSSQPPDNGSSGDYATEVAKMIDMVTETDAHGDMSMRPYYEEVVLGLDAYCSENVGEVVMAVATEMDRRGEIQNQFSVLNEMESVLVLTEDAPSRPTPCEPLIGE